MSGVSVREGMNIDVAAILQGGPAMQSRIAQLKDLHDANAQRKAEADQAETVAARIIEEAKAKAASIIDAAVAEADMVIAEAKVRRKVFDDDLARIKASLRGQIEPIAKSVA